MKKAGLAGLMCLVAMAVVMASPQTNDADLKAVQFPKLTVDGNCVLSNAQGLRIGISSGAFAGVIPITTVTNAYSIDVSGITGLMPLEAGNGVTPPDATITLDNDTITHWNITNLISITGGANDAAGSVGGAAATVTLSGLSSDPGLNIQYIFGGGDQGSGVYSGGGASLSISGSLTTLNLSSLVDIWGSFTEMNDEGGSASLSIVAPALTSLDISSLQRVDDNYSANPASFRCDSSPGLTSVSINSTVYLGTASNATTFSINGAALGGASVNAMLMAFSAGFSTSAIIDLSGGTSAAPSGDAIDAASNLASRGCSVTTN